jgi:hypothetical protein
LDQPDRCLQRRRPWMKLRGKMSKGGAMARPLRILVVLIGLGALLLTPRAAAQETLVVESAPTARLLQGGKAVVVQVTVTCRRAQRCWRRSCT